MPHYAQSVTVFIWEVKTDYCQTDTVITQGTQFQQAHGDQVSYVQVSYI